MVVLSQENILLIFITDPREMCLIINISMLKQIISVLLAFLFISYHGTAQDSNDGYPEIGKPCPYFLLKNVENFNSDQVSLNDLKGKHTIIDFWNKYCTACVESFPKTNELYERFKQTVNIIVVGTEEAGIKLRFEKYKTSLKLNFPNAFDYPLYNRFVPGGAPHLIWIDDRGIVVAITSSKELTSENIEAFTAGKKFIFFDRSYKTTVKNEVPLDLTQPLFINGNGGENVDFLYRSLLTKWDHSIQQGIYEKIDLYADKGMYQGTGLPLVWLYTMAYAGVINWQFGDSLYQVMSQSLVLEIKDTALFQFDFQLASGIYNYSLLVPPQKASREYLMKMMQKDLKGYFGYDVFIETRKMPYWKLIASEKAKRTLLTKGKKQVSIWSDNAYVIQNSPVENLLGLVAAHEVYSKLPFMDETGIKGNIDIALSVDLLANKVLVSFEDIRKALKEKGLDLVKGERTMKVLVIKDPVEDGLN
jgi:uncharacterized protein (TIGR03435 family)